MEENKFQLADYIIFGVMLLISVGIGVFYACAGGKQQTNREFLMADRSMRSLPVALSVLASFFSASTLLGTPAEVYVYGIQYWISVFGAILAPLTGAFLFGPMFFKLKLVSVYEVSFRKGRHWFTLVSSIWTFLSRPFSPRFYFWDGIFFISFQFIHWKIIYQYFISIFFFFQFQYLELRFHSKSVRLFAAALFILRLVRDKLKYIHFHKWLFILHVCQVSWNGIQPDAPRPPP